MYINLIPLEVGSLTVTLFLYLFVCAIRQQTADTPTSNKHKHTRNHYSKHTSNPQSAL